jgi:PAS domain S-box-containing protein
MLEDNPDDAELVHHLLSNEIPDFEFNLAVNKDQFLDALDHFNPGIILADNALPQFSAREALVIARRHRPDLPFIMVTGSVSEEFAADIIKLGADDYILKDRMKRLPAAIDAAMEKQRAANETRVAQEELRRSEERFRTLSRATKDAIWDWDLVSNEIWWNENFYQLLGYAPHSPVPGPYEWTKRVHPADRNKVMTRLNGVVSNAIPSWEDEFRILVKDGTYATVMDRGYVIADNGGKPVRVIGVLVNITEQKRLVREMEILSMIVRESNNSVVIFDPKTARISWVNPGFTRCTGYTLQDLSGLDTASILKNIDIDQEGFDYLARQIGASRPFCCDLAIHTKQGESRWQTINGQPMGGHDRHETGYFLMATDISDRRRMEAEATAVKIDRQRESTRIILQTQEKERNALGRELHDNINQILAAVNLKLGYYLEEPTGNLDIVQGCRKDLTRAIKETRELSHHLVMPRFSEINLKDELELLFGNCRTDKAILFNFEIADEAKIPAAIKETIFRIAQEQLSNILKHARATKIEVRLHVDLHTVELAIQDNGVGFDVQRFGKGIGISNIYSRVESYNGVATIVSKPGRGCILSLTIPLPDVNAVLQRARP